MKLQKQGSIINKPYSAWSGNFWAGIYLFGILMILACQNDIEMIDMLSTDLDLPVQTGKNFEVQYTDSGRLQVIFKAPLVERYVNDEDEGEYYEFTDGIEIMFFNKDEKLESTITAGYGKYW